MNQLKCRKLTDDDKQQICGWKYAGEYEIYNLSSLIEGSARTSTFVTGAARFSGRLGLPLKEKGVSRRL